MAHYQVQSEPQKISIVVDRQRFLNTRNALTNAFVGLSGAIDDAVKAYVNHTNAVLDGVGGSTLDISGLIQPFNMISNAQGVAQLAQQAILQSGNGNYGTPNAAINADGTKKKRQYKPRDPNAPKRPLTAYFRYLQEQRPKISEEIQRNQELHGGKSGDISKIATERWNALDEKTRLPYRRAYEKELKGYEEAVKIYKQQTGQATENSHDDDVAVEDEHGAPAAPMHTAATVKNEDDEEDDGSNDDDEDDNGGSDDTDDSSSEEDESEEEVVAPPPPPPEVLKKTPKTSAKKTKAGADPAAPSMQFSSLAVPIEPPANSSPSRKRKADAAASETAEKKKKGSRKSKVDQEAVDAAAASSQLQIDPQLQDFAQPLSSPQPADGAGKQKKEKKKKRKSEATAV